MIEMQVVKVKKRTFRKVVRRRGKKFVMRVDPMKQWRIEPVQDMEMYFDPSIIARMEEVTKNIAASLAMIQPDVNPFE